MGKTLPYFSESKGALPSFLSCRIEILSSDEKQVGMLPIFTKGTIPDDAKMVPKVMGNHQK